MNSSVLLFMVVLLLCCCSLINKQVVTRAHPFTIQYIQSIFNCCLLPMWYWLSKRFTPPDQLDAKIATLSIAGTVISTVGFLLFLTALKDKPISVATCFLSTYPALTMIVCAAFGMEKMTIPRVLGVFIILCGVVMIQYFDK